MNTYTRLDGTFAPCAGLNHNDAGEIMIHDRCGAQVAKREDGKIFDVKAFGQYGARKFTCWNMLHTCDPAHVEMMAEKAAESVAGGIITKSCVVVVVKGRKVAKGTTGVVFWMGEDSWGKAKIGFKTAEGETVWIAQANCEVAN
jgi:hypothetical protein